MGNITYFVLIFHEFSQNHNVEGDGLAKCSVFTVVGKQNVERS
jgi:hypothetical protein